MTLTTRCAVEALVVKGFHISVAISVGLCYRAPGLSGGVQIGLIVGEIGNRINLFDRLARQHLSARQVHLFPVQRPQRLVATVELDDVGRQLRRELVVVVVAGGVGERDRWPDVPGAVDGERRHFGAAAIDRRQISGHLLYIIANGHAVVLLMLLDTTELHRQAR